MPLGLGDSGGKSVPDDDYSLQELYDMIERQREKLVFFTEILLAEGYDPLELLEATATG